MARTRIAGGARLDRARSTSEALKSEVFMYLAGTGRYRGTDRDHQLQDQVEAIERDAGDLLLHTSGLQPLVGDCRKSMTSTPMCSTSISDKG
jgi:hypothetical protein